MSVFHVRRHIGFDVRVFRKSLLQLQRIGSDAWPTLQMRAIRIYEYVASDYHQHALECRRAFCEMLKSDFERSRLWVLPLQQGSGGRWLQSFEAFWTVSPTPAGIDTANGQLCIPGADEKPLYLGSRPHQHNALIPPAAKKPPPPLFCTERSIQELRTKIMQMEEGPKLFRDDNTLA